MRTVSGLLSGAILLCAHPIFAQDNRHEIVGNLIGTRSLKILGSMDARYGAGASVQWLNPSRKLSFRGLPAKLNVEGYALLTNTNFAYGRGKRVVHTGVLVSGRYEYPLGANRWFWEAGWGLNYSSRPSHDLESSFNSTPTIGVGAILGKKSPTYLTLRLMHMSNAGLSRKNNKGQNMLQLMIGFRF
jgi:hypothetical protein